MLVSALKMSKSRSRMHIVLPCSAFPAELHMLILLFRELNIAINQSFWAWRHLHHS